MITGLKVTLGLLIAAACLIPYLALTEHYELAMAAEPETARVITVEGSRIRYEVLRPASPRANFDGWVGPRHAEVPDDAVLAVGAPLVVRRGELELNLERPSRLLLLGFLLGLLLALYWGVAPTIWRRRVEKCRHDPLEMIRLNLRRSRKNQFFVAMMVIACGVFIGVIPFFDREATMVMLVILGGLGAITIAAGFWALYKFFRVLNINKAPVLLALTASPNRVVWIYQTTTLVNGIATYNLGVHTADGERFDFYLGDVDAVPLVHALRQVVPGAVFGYSERRLKQWKTAPDAFLQAERETAHA